MRENNSSYSFKKRCSYLSEILLNTIISAMLYILIVEGIFKWGHLQLAYIYIAIDILFSIITCFSLPLSKLEEVHQSNQNLTKQIDENGNYKFWHTKINQILIWLFDVVMDWILIAILGFLLQIIFHL
ncbi:MAG: hypothetical protein HDS11_02800 [Bacteroides sp.]|nr:hypothetical protein [Bacteroides sp.]